MTNKIQLYANSEDKQPNWMTNSKDKQSNWMTNKLKQKKK